ncbi:MAG: putative DNA binding domain-containing protein [Anaerolineae bacterium]|nr:putative DNA binding domain-containing protein [Anaerolineae bacterium]
MVARKKARTTWFRADLHIHTPASADYQDVGISYLDILRKAEQRGLDVIAFTDHNTIAGYLAMQREIEQLTFLQKLERATLEEQRVLADYRRLLDKILVLPGFEFTATFGFHILGLFSPQIPLRVLEHLLLSLNIPPQVLDAGSSEVGASSDVLSAYRAIYEAGGICIAAHVNSAHGVAMTGLDFGGQTRIAYTQDRYLHALEVTDLHRRDRRSTARFFDGTKPEYPRRMRCIQGSDAHALNAIRDKNRVITLGVGDRVTEVALTECTFEALYEMFSSSDFSRSRAYVPNKQPEDFIQSAREEGASIVQAFHENLGKTSVVIADVCAFANTNGGTIYIGVSTDKKKKVSGIAESKEAVEQLRREIGQNITPTINAEIDTHDSQGKTVIRVQVPYGEDRPYAIDSNQIYIRDGTETVLAVRDEIVNLVRQGMAFKEALERTKATTMPIDSPSPLVTEDTDTITPPRAGVEILAIEKRDGTHYYTMHDLRNGNIVRNVTLTSARRLWHYAVKQQQSQPLQPEQIRWQGEIGLWRRYKKGGDVRYDLVMQEGERVRVFYGVTENGMHGKWQMFLEPEE